MANVSRARAWAGVSNVVTSGEQQQLEEALVVMRHAYEVGRYELPPEELVRQLREHAGSADIDYIASLLGFEGLGLLTADVTCEREYAISNSHQAWRRNPLYQWSVWSWTNWGLGESVQVTPADPAAAKVFSEFWADNTSILGQDKIHGLSEWLLVTGDRYLVHFASTVDGEDKLRSILPSEITEIITAPNDSSVPLFYKRVWKAASGTQETLYYPDWEAFFNDPDALERAKLPTNAKRADQMSNDTLGDGEPETVAVIQHIAHNRKSESDLRGWPLGTISGPFQQALKRFWEDRLTVAASKAMFVRRKQVDSGSRGVEAVRARLQSGLSSTSWTDTNPRAPAGSVEIENARITTTDLPMSTGAFQAEADNKVLSWPTLLGDGLFPTTAGLDTSRWATALTMDKNQSMLWARYRSFWAQQLKNMVRIVLLFREKYGNVTFTDKSAAVSIDTLSMVDFPPVVDALSSLFRDALTPLVEAGVIPAAAAGAIAAKSWQVALQALGVEGAGELASLETFGVGKSAQEGAGVAAVAQMIGENLANGDVEMGAVLEWAIGEGVASVLEQMGE